MPMEFETRRQSSDAKLQAFTQEVVHFLDPLGLEYSYRAAEENVGHLGCITGPDGCEIRLRCDGYDFEKTKRIAVSGGWPDPIRYRGDLHSFYPSRHDDRPASITIALKRGPEVVARDILRRFMPNYLPVWHKMVIWRDEAIARNTAKDEAYLTLARADDRKPPAEDCMYFGPGRSHDLNRQGPSGTVSVSSYNGMSAKLEIHNLPIETAATIIALLNELA